MRCSAAVHIPTLSKPELATALQPAPPTPTTLTFGLVFLSPLPKGSSSGRITMSILRRLINLFLFQILKPRIPVEKLRINLKGEPSPSGRGRLRGSVAMIYMGSDFTAYDYHEHEGIDAPRRLRVRRIRSRRGVAAEPHMRELSDQRDGLRVSWSRDPGTPCEDNRPDR